MRTLFLLDKRCKHVKFRAFGQFHNFIENAVDGSLNNFFAADRTVRRAAPGVQKAQIIVDLRDRSDGGTRIFRGSLLVDRNCRRKALDAVDIRLIELPQEHTRIGGQRLDKPSVSLRVDRIKGKRRFARTGKSRKHHHFIARNGDVDVF